MHYFLDGYNLLFSLFNGLCTLHQERNQMLEELDEILRQVNVNMTIVFDAHLRDEQMCRMKFCSLDLVFTDFAQTADDYILESLNFCKNKRNETVITNDQRLAWRARDLGAKTESIAIFLKRLAKIPQKLTHKSKQLKKQGVHKPSEPLSGSPKLGDFPGTIDYYLTIFEKKWKNKNDEE